MARGMLILDAAATASPPPRHFKFHAHSGKSRAAKRAEAVAGRLAAKRRHRRYSMRRAHFITSQTAEMFLASSRAWDARFSLMIDAFALASQPHFALRFISGVAITNK